MVYDYLIRTHDKKLLDTHAKTSMMEKMIYKVGIKDDEIRITADSPLDAACVAFELYLSRGNVSAPLVLSVKELTEGKETLIFTPVVLADIGLHKESASMMKAVDSIIEK